MREFAVKEGVAKPSKRVDFEAQDAEKVGLSCMV